MTTFYDGLSEVLKAGFPIIAMKTYEFDRVYSLVKRYCREQDSLLFQWNCSDGLGEMGLNFDSILPVGDRIYEPGMVLEEIERRLDTRDHEIYVLEGMADYLHDHRVKVLLRKLAYDIPKGAGRKHVMMIMPVAVIPEELARHVSVLALPLPNQQELTASLNAIIEEFDATVEEGLKYEIVKAADGLTLLEANRAFRLAGVRDKFGHRALESIREAFLLRPKNDA